MDMASAEQVLLEMQGLIASMQQEIGLAMEEKRRREEEAAAAAAARERQKELQKQELAKAQVPSPAKPVRGESPDAGGFSHPFFIAHSLALFRSEWILVVVPPILYCLCISSNRFDASVDLVWAFK